MLIKLNTSFTDTSSSLHVTDRRRIRERYLSRNYTFDLLALAPLDIFARTLGANTDVMLFLRLPKLITSYRLYVFFKKGKRLSTASRIVAELQVGFMSSSVRSQTTWDD
jgi:hypothetical protein